MKIVRRKECGHPRPPMTFREHMERFFDDPFWDPFAAWEKPLHPIRELRGDFVPRMDMSEDDTEVKIKVNIPGYDTKDIELEIQDNNLMIKGTMKEEKEEKDKHYYRKERATGSFERWVALPENIIEEKAECEAKNGILTIIIPKSEVVEKKQPLKIKIKD